MASFVVQLSVGWGCRIRVGRRARVRTGEIGKDRVPDEEEKKESAEALRADLWEGEKRDFNAA